MEELRTILLSREPLYARAAAELDTAGLSIEKAAEKLRKAVTPALDRGSLATLPRAAAVR